MKTHHCPCCGQPFTLKHRYPQTEALDRFRTPAQQARSAAIHHAAERWHQQRQP